MRTKQKLVMKVTDNLFKGFQEHGLQTPNEDICNSKKSENFGRCGKQDMLRPYVKNGSGSGFEAVQ